MDSATLAKTSWLFVSFGDAGVNILITTKERPFTPPRGCQTSWVSAHQDMTCHGPRRRTARIRSSVEGNQGLTRNMSYTKSPAVDPWPPRYGKRRTPRQERQIVAVIIEPQRFEEQALQAQVQEQNRVGVPAPVGPPSEPVPEDGHQPERSTQGHPQHDRLPPARQLSMGNLLGDQFA
jgi:hypothetical protein